MKVCSNEMPECIFAPFHHIASSLLSSEAAGLHFGKEGCLKVVAPVEAAQNRGFQRALPARPDKGLEWLRLLKKREKFHLWTVAFALFHARLHDLAIPEDHEEVALSPHGKVWIAETVFIPVKGIRGTVIPHHFSAMAVANNGLDLPESHAGLDPLQVVER
jgi:hypothetical protein